MMLLKSVQWYLCDMDILRSFKSVQITKVSWLSRSINTFNTICDPDYKGMDYASVVIIKCLQLTGFTVAISIHRMK